jgi:NADPH-dependent curcumin reductase CurA
MEGINRQFRLAARPVGAIKNSDFEYREEPIPVPQDGEVLARNFYLSLDPTNRVWMSDQEQYMPPVAIGDVMRGITLSVVEESRNPGYKKGDILWGLLGWQDYALISGDGLQYVMPIDTTLLPGKLTAYLGPLGMTGCTAYFGLLDLGEPKPGETVLVSAAAGSVGSMVGQIDKIKGCYVVGAAGSDDKCRWLVEELGFDAAINYKTNDLLGEVKKACPQGVDIYFDNVGGDLLDAALAAANWHARIPLCGLISNYNSTEPVPGPYNYSAIMMKRIKVQGFIVSDFFPRWNQAYAEIAAWIKSGQVKYSEDIVQGLENAPRSLMQIFEGSSQGKLIVKISEEPS